MCSSLCPVLLRTVHETIEANMDVGYVGYGSISIPDFSPMEPDTTSYVPPSLNAHSDAYELDNCAQNLIKNLSKLLDENESQDSFFSHGNLSQRNNDWSTKDGGLQNFQSKAKSQDSSDFALNCASYDAFSKTKGQAADNQVEEFFQPPSSGFSTNEQLLVNLPKGFSDSFTQQSLQKPPPGLPVPNMANVYLSELQQNNHDNVFRPTTVVNSGDFFYGNRYTQEMDKPMGNKQYTPLDQLVSSFQSFRAAEQDTGEFRNMSTVRMQHEDHMADKWGNTSPAMPTRENPSAQMQRQLGGDFGTIQREGNCATRKQLFKQDLLQDRSAFTLQNTEYAQQPTVSVSNQHPNKMLLQRENTSLPVNMNHYPKHQVQQSPMQSKFKPQMQKENKMAGFPCESFPTQPLTNDAFIQLENRPLSQTPIFYFPFNMRPQRFDNSVLGAGLTQQFMSLVYPENDLRRHPGLPMNPSFKHRSSLTFGGSGSSMETCDGVSANEIPRFNSGLNSMMSKRGENTYRGMASAVTGSVNQGGAVSQLYFYLDECYEQWRCLEKERKQMVIDLSKMFPGILSTTRPNSSLLKMPPNPTKVDWLIVNQIREQAQVSSLLECLPNIPPHANIYTALTKHHMAVSVTRDRRRKEISNLSQNQHQRAHLTEERDTMLLVTALKDLSFTTRKLRTAMWCALQLSQPKQVHADLW